MDTKRGKKMGSQKMLTENHWKQKRSERQKSDTKNKGNDYKPVTHIIDINPTISAITLSVNGLNTLNKRKRLLEQIKTKQNET